MSILTETLGVDRQSNAQISRFSEQLKQQEVEGRLIRVAFLAMAFALATLYAVDNIQPPPSIADSKTRVYPAPLL